MIGSELKLTLNSVGRLMTRGDVDGLARYFECPLPVYMDDKFFLFSSREKLIEALRIYTADASTAEVRRLEPVLLRVEDATPNRSLFVVHWKHLRDDGSCARSNVVRYVARRSELDGILRIELVEYLQIGSRQVPQQLIELVVA